MAFLAGYEHDVFISYAHVDDQPLIAAGGLERSSGWVSSFVQNLKNELAQKFGRSDAVSVWFDNHNLRGNHQLLDEIGARVERTAILITVLSPGYLASQWCQDEFRLFTRACGGDPGKRLFVIEKAPIDGEPVPAPIADRRSYRFWYRDRAEQPRTYAVPEPRREEIEYFRQVEDAARDIRTLCRAMQQHQPYLPGRSTTTDRVFLAEVTDDLECKREEMRRYLEQHGVAVLPESSYALGRAEFEAALESDLASTRLFVQLLGPIPGKRPRELPDGYGWLQFEAARRRGLKILQWRSPELVTTDVEWPRHRELLELQTVHAISLERFKRAIVAALAPPPEPPPRRETGARPLVFLNTEPRHHAIAEEIRVAVGDRASWAELMHDGPAEAVRKDLEENLIYCDAMVMVYADNTGWARAQLRSFHKVAPRRVRPVRVIPVIDAPPQEKPELGFFLPEMVMIDGRAGIGPDVLGRLSESLQL